MGNEILMSDQTRQLFRPEFWEFVSGIEVAPKLVFSRADFEHLAPAERQSERAENFDNLKDLGVNTPELSRYIYEQFENHSAQEHNAGAFAHDSVIPLLREHGHEIGLDISALPEDTRIDIVSVMSDNNVRGFFATISGIPEEQLTLKDIPIEDLRAFIMLHEIGHLVYAGPDMSTLESEWMAETHAHETYKDAYEKGIVSTPDLPLLFSQARSMNAFSQSQLYTVTEMFDSLVNLMPDYEMTAIAASYEPEENLDFKTLNTDLQGVYKTILVEVGKNFSATPEFEYNLHVAGAAKVYVAMLENEELAPEQRKEIRQFFINLSDLKMENLDQEIAYKKGQRANLPDEIDYGPVLAEFKKVFVVPNEHQELYDAGRETYMKEKAEGLFLSEGLELARGQPELIYAAARHLLEEGTFDNNRAGIALTENFVRGAETLAPEHFGVDAVPGPTYSALHPPAADNTLTVSPGSIERDIPSHAVTQP